MALRSVVGQPFLPNAIHERWIGTVKSVTRDAMLQSGFPEKTVPFALTYSAMYLACNQPATIHPNERDAAGNVLLGARFFGEMCSADQANKGSIVVTVEILKVIPLQVQHFSSRPMERHCRRTPRA